MNHCTHIITKGKRREQTCDRYCSSDLCRIHEQSLALKTSKAQRANSDLNAFMDRSKSRIIDKLTADPPGLKKSDFAITFNSNKTVKGLTDYQADIIHLLSEYLFDNGGIMDYIVGVDCELNQSDIISEYIDSSFEVGEEYGKIHIHAILQIKHKSKIRIDLDRLRSYINDALGYRCHLNVQSIKTGGTVGDWLRYIRKKRTQD